MELLQEGGRRACVWVVEGWWQSLFRPRWCRRYPPRHRQDHRCPPLADPLRTWFCRPCPGATQERRWPRSRPCAAVALKARPPPQGPRPAHPGPPGRGRPQRPRRRVRRPHRPQGHRGLPVLLLADRHSGRRCRLHGNRATLPGLAAARPLHDVWLRAARTGLDDQDLTKAARACIAAVDNALAVPRPRHPGDERSPTASQTRPHLLFLEVQEASERGRRSGGAAPVLSAQEGKRVLIRDVFEVWLCILISSSALSPLPEAMAS
ncbi:hypothetical protein SCANM124S_00185 [Streptomyces canus]